MSKSEASNLLFSLIDECNSGKLRADYVEIFDKMVLKSKKVFKFIENLLISDEDEEVRIIAARVMINIFPENILTPLNWMIHNDNSVIVLRLIHKFIKNLDNPYSSLLNEEIKERYIEIASNYGVILKEAEFLMDIGLNYDYHKESYSNPSRCVIFGNNIITVIKNNHIRALSLSNWKPGTIPSSICNLEKLKYLNLSCNELNILPKSMDMLSRLNYLDLGWNNFTTIPSFLAKVNSVKNLRLDIAHNEIKSIPKWIKELKSLNYLNLRDNQIQSIPDSIGSLKNLEYLDLRENMLQSIPESIGSLNSLRVLWLNSNRITHLPSSIGYLKLLKILDLGNNHLHILPESISMLESLEYLNLKKNQILKIPDSIISIKTLKRLRF
ncbi:MAG: hypothetical protein EU532_04180 [Promethearchaeota archaeon]|nr:MAG: hypothetical protein EU532_04180 [Candidatus Lokiarchaeota archaeon]